ncbi:hypothetical protein RI367_007776 [Sorochytrium milnesiophthora]
MTVATACARCCGGNDNEQQQQQQQQQQQVPTSQLQSLLPSLLASLERNPSSATIVCAATANRGAIDDAFRSVSAQAWDTYLARDSSVASRLQIRYVSDWSMLKALVSGWTLVAEQVQQQLSPGVDNVSLVIDTADDWMARISNARELLWFMSTLAQMKGTVTLLTRGLLCGKCNSDSLTPSSRDMLQAAQHYIHYQWTLS